MRLATLKINGEELAAVFTEKGLLPIRAINDALGFGFPETLFSLIDTGRLAQMNAWYKGAGRAKLERLPRAIPLEEAVFAPLYRNPRRIFGIGLNYADHAGDIGDAPPQGFPGSFFKAADTLIGPGDDICLPALKEACRTTAEAELGVIMGKRCRDVAEEDWLDAVAGFTTVLDMTEESILKGNEFLDGNPRYLTLVKNFPTFFSFGPEFVTADEVPDVAALTVQSVHNGKLHAENRVANMTHSPARLVSLHSSIQGWFPGDVLSTGTPRAFPIADGDVAECRIIGPDGFAFTPLTNPVRDLKKKRAKRKTKAKA